MSLYFTEQDIDRLIAEDVPYGDLTCRSLGLAMQTGRMAFSARHPLVVCGAALAARMIVKLGGTVDFVHEDGAFVPAGTVLLQAHGPAVALHGAWKSAQTLMEWCGGLASAVYHLRQAAQAVAADVRLACARKAPPGTRKLAVLAVQAGGAEMHRLGLSETILIFPEHLALMPEMTIADAIAQAKQAAPERMVVIEVTDPAQALLAAQGGAHVVQLEKFTPQAVRHVVDQVGGKCLIAAAGGIKLDNVARYAAAGANLLVTSAPYSAVPAEVQVRITPMV